MPNKIENIHKLEKHIWQKPHQPNLTGTDSAYYPNKNNKNATEEGNVLMDMELEELQNGGPSFHDLFQVRFYVLSLLKKAKAFTYI